jgi:hypothetical protein
MRLSTLLLLPFTTLVLSSPNPRPAPQPVAAPAPTLAARLVDAPNSSPEKRQLSISLFGATAVISNGVICGGLGPLTGCFGQPGTNTVKGTIGTGGGTVTGSGYTLAVSGTTGTFTDASSAASATATNNGAVAPTGGPARAAAAMAAGVGALALGLL